MAWTFNIATPSWVCTQALFETAFFILCQAWRIGSPIRLLSVNTSSLTSEHGAQMSLLVDAQKQEKNAKLDAAMDKIRARYGTDALQFGSVIQSELKVPVKYIGVGESIDDLQKFDSDEFVNALFDRKKGNNGE